MDPIAALVIVPLALQLVGIVVAVAIERRHVRASRRASRPRDATDVV